MKRCYRIDTLVCILLISGVVFVEAQLPGPLPRFFRGFKVIPLIVNSPQPEIHFRKKGLPGVSGFSDNTAVNIGGLFQPGVLFLQNTQGAPRGYTDNRIPRLLTDCNSFIVALPGPLPVPLKVIGPPCSVPRTLLPLQPPPL